jgi:hypothetical protein
MPITSVHPYPVGLLIIIIKKTKAFLYSSHSIAELGWDNLHDAAKQTLLHMRALFLGSHSASPSPPPPSCAILLAGYHI